MEIAQNETAGFDHSGSYLLLEELAAPAEAPDLTVTSIGSGATITVRQPYDGTGSVNDKVTLDAVNIEADATLVLNGDLTVQGLTTIADDTTLTVTNNDKTLTLAGGFADNTTGSFAQTGGDLVRDNGDLAVGGDMTLSGVTANVGTGKLGSLCYGDGNVTHVVLEDNSVVTAAEFGALGPQNDTFTFVDVEDGSSYGSKLIADWYRLTYDLEDTVTEGKIVPPSVLRTETTSAGTTVLKEIPDSLNPHNPVFECWYIFSPDGTERLALMDDAGTLPAGLNGKLLLTAGLAEDDALSGMPGHDADERTSDQRLMELELVENALHACKEGHEDDQQN